MPRIYTMQEQSEPLPAPDVIHHNNDAIEEIAADILRREELGELPRMSYEKSTWRTS